MTSKVQDLSAPDARLIYRALSRVQIQPDDLLPAIARFARYAVRRGIDKLEDRRNARKKGYYLHYCVHDPRGNCGDTVLYRSVREIFDSQLGATTWVRRQLRALTSRKDVENINSSARAIVVGGGGLIMSDLVKTTVSGWQWNISGEEVDKLTPPLIIFAVGYNQFRGDNAFKADFNTHIERVVRRSTFVGLRNNGSIAKLRSHLPLELHSKIHLQPCPTTVLRKFHSDLSPTSRADMRKELAVNLAFDRADRRFGDNPRDQLRKVAKALQWASNNGWKINLAVHGFQDDPAISFLRSENLDFEIVRLNLLPWKSIVRFYSNMPLTIGMRGHAQMIPFGTGNAIISLISHNKLGYFLSDIGHPEWGVEMADPQLTDRLIYAIESFWENMNARFAQIDAAQDDLWNTTVENFSFMKNSMPSAISKI